MAQRYKNTFALIGDRQALTDQVGHSLTSGDSTDAKGFHQLVLARQAITRAVHPRLNLVAQLFRNTESSSATSRRSRSRGGLARPSYLWGQPGVDGLPHTRVLPPHRFC